MKKKPERYSFKKLAELKKEFKQEEIKSYQKVIKSQLRNKSSERAERIITAYDNNSKFKIAPKDVIKQRTRTETDEFNQTKIPFQKMVTNKKEKQVLKEKGKFKYNLGIKKLNLASDVYDVLKNNSLQKNDTPHSGKHYSFRKAHESHRSGIKKTALQKYVSQSLQNLQLGKKKTFSSRQNDLKNTLKRPQGEQSSLKTRHLSKQKGEPQSQTHKQANSSNVDKECQIYKKGSPQGQKEDSVEKIDLKWEKKKKNPYDLSKDEMDTFGDRFPDGFDKIKLLGRGGFSLVWLGEHKKSKKKYAIKQIITESSHQTHIKQIWFGTYFFEFGGAPKQQFVSSPGINNLVKLYYYFINKKDTWILYEKCGDSLGNTLYELKSELFNNEKVYRIYYKDFYLRVKNNQNQLRKIILDIARALELLSQNNIVHSDLKTQNILIRTKTEDEIKLSPKESCVLQTKLIDYGSSFVFSNLRQLSMATPEYMAPQILNFILYENQFEYIPKLLDYVQKYNSPWVIDVWSLGSVLLQIVSGVPLWMSLKTIVRKKSQQVIRYGLFAIKGRAFDKIIKQQLQVVQNLDHYLYEQNYSGIVLEEDLRNLLKRMLALNPSKRISPTQIIECLQARLTDKLM